MNKVILIGHLGKDPEVRYTNDGKAVAKVSMAVNRRGGEGADFIRIVAFDKTASLFEKYLKKGSHIGVSGRIQTGSYQDKDGKTVYTTDVIVEEMEFLDKKGESKPTESKPTEKKTADFMNIDIEIGEEELPFL